MKSLISILLVLLSHSCIKEAGNISNSIFENTTAHSIKVSAYQNGIVLPGSSFELSANQSKQVFSLSSRGKGNNGVWFGRYSVLIIDSFVVAYDGAYSIAHYKSNLVGNNPKRYLYSSKRNIYSDSSFSQTIVDDSKYFRTYGLKYRFTEQDYLDAK